jgi:hypothetical protein
VTADSSPDTEEVEVISPDAVCRGDPVSGCLVTSRLRVRLSLSGRSGGALGVRHLLLLELGEALRGRGVVLRALLLLARLLPPELDRFGRLRGLGSGRVSGAAGAAGGARERRAEASARVPASRGESVRCPFRAWGQT